MNNFEHQARPMHLELIDWLIVAAFLILSLAIGLKYRASAGKSVTDYFLGGRNLPWYIAGISMVATTFAADTPLAVTELVGLHGISGNWLWWTFLFGGMLTTFFFARLWRRAEVLTEVELIEIRYSGKAAAFLRGFRSIYLGLFMNVLIIGWVNVALMSILKVFFDLPDDQLLWYALAAMTITAIYSSMSGLMGVAMTDVVQFIIAMTGCVILAVIVVNSPEVGGIDGLKMQLPSWSLEFFPHIGSAGDAAGALSITLGAFLAYTTIQWWASWYPGAEPGGGGYIVQRMMSTKSEKDAIAATLLFQISHYCLRPWPWILVGLSAMILYPELGPDAKREGFVMAMKDYLPAGLKGLLLVAFLAAYMSTISTQLNWGASYLINDFYHRFVDKAASQKKLVAASRITTFLIMLIALFATSQITTISGVWTFIIECGAGLGMVLILRWYWWRINAWSEISATIAPFIAYGFGHYGMGWEFPDSYFFTVGFTTVVWISVTFLTKPTNRVTLEAFYKKVRPDGAWAPLRAANETGKNLWPLVVCWLSAVLLTYSILFLTGKLIFKEWNEAMLSAAVALVSYLVLRRFLDKTKVFSD